jgi:LacI family transcriptional regulator
MSGTKRAPTIYDVADKAGVSIATVSRVLNTPHQVNEEKRLKVFAAIDHLGFTPSAEASARARKAVGRIGILTPFFTLPSFVQRMRGVASALADSRYELVVYPVDSLEKLEGYLTVLPNSNRLDGLITVSMPVDKVASQRLVNSNLETVLIESTSDLLSSIQIDDRAGGAMAARHLIQRGHTRCAYIGDADYLDYCVHPGELRLTGYRSELAKNGIELLEEHTKLISVTSGAPDVPIKDMLASPEPPTAIFASTDTLAMHVLKIARKLGLRIPKDVAIIGFDDLDMADYLDLTTIRQQLDESGRAAVEMLMTRLNDPSRPVHHINFQLKVVERETT